MSFTEKTGAVSAQCGTEAWSETRMPRTVQLPPSWLGGTDSQMHQLN